MPMLKIFNRSQRSALGEAQSDFNLGRTYHFRAKDEYAYGDLESALKDITNAIRKYEEAIECYDKSTPLTGEYVEYVYTPATNNLEEAEQLKTELEARIRDSDEFQHTISACEQPRQVMYVPDSPFACCPTSNCPRF